MTLYYRDISAPYDGVLELVKRGLTFKARPELLTIELEGGY